MLRKTWLAVFTPSLTRRLVFAQLSLLLAVWLVMLVLIIRDIAFTDQWYEPKLMHNRGAMILAVTDSLADQPGKLEASLRAIDEFQRNEHREEDTSGLRTHMMVWIGERLVYVTPGERREVRTTRFGEIEHTVQDGKRLRVWSQRSETSGARVALLLPADAPEVFLALWSRGFVLLPIMVAMPIFAIPAWLSVWFALKPFREVSAEIAAKGPQDLTPLAAQPKHRELQALGVSVNGLLGRVRDGVERERRFIADAAHELRTPLAAMRINVEALQRRTQSQEDGALLDGLRHSGDRATRLVSQLLSLMRSDAVPENVARQRVRLDELAQERLAALGGIAHERDVELELDAADAVSVAGDRQGLITLIDNLVENAIKYSPPRGVVRVKVATTGASAVTLTVEDAGPGIPAELRERVFERFYRAPDQGQSGSGLGLAIVRAVAESHHAIVTLDSPGDRGLRAIVTFS